MHRVLTDMSPTALAAAIEENLIAFFPHFGCLPGAEVHDDPSLLWIVSDVPLCLFNSVARARLAPEDVDAAIADQVAVHRARKVPMMWWVGPSTRPAGLATALLRHGFEHDDEELGMAVDLERLGEAPALPPGGRVVKVADGAMLKQWNEARSTGWGSSESGRRSWMQFATSHGLGPDQPFRYFTAFWDDQPVAAAMTFLAAGVAGVYNVATVPEMRRKGFGAAVTLAAIRDARDEGYHIATLGASALGAPVYRRLGFREYCTVDEYTWQDKELG